MGEALVFLQVRGVGCRPELFHSISSPLFPFPFLPPAPESSVTVRDRPIFAPKPFNVSPVVPQRASGICSHLGLSLSPQLREHWAGLQLQLLRLSLEPGGGDISHPLCRS